MRPRAASDMSQIIRIVAVAMLMCGCDVGGSFPEENKLGGPDAMAVTECQFSEPAAVQVGGVSASGDFEARADGQDMAAVLAPSGFYMLLPSIRARGIDPGQSGSAGQPSDPLVSVDIFKQGVRVGGSTEQRLGLTETAFGYDLVDIFTPLDVPPAEFEGYDLDLRASVTDACGRTASGLLVIHAVLE